MLHFFANVIPFSNLLFNASFPARNIACGISVIKSTRNQPECIFLNKRVFENFILADEPFAKALRNFETCVLVNKNLCGRLVSWLELLIRFDERFKIT